MNKKFLIIILICLMAVFALLLIICLLFNKKINNKRLKILICSITGFLLLISGLIIASFYFPRKIKNHYPLEEIKEIYHYSLSLDTPNSLDCYVLPDSNIDTFMNEVNKVSYVPFYHIISYKSLVECSDYFVIVFENHYLLFSDTICMCCEGVFVPKYAISEQSFSLGDNGNNILNINNYDYEQLVNFFGSTKNSVNFN